MSANFLGSVRGQATRHICPFRFADINTSCYFLLLASPRRLSSLQPIPSQENYCRIKLQGRKWLINCRDKSVNNAEHWNCELLFKTTPVKVCCPTASVSTRPHLSHRQGSNLSYSSFSGLVLLLVWGYIMKTRHYITM